MKTIGLVDYFIDEWHSNNYIPWIEELCKEKSLDFKVTYAWAELDKPEGKRSTEEWCGENRIRKAESIDELCRKCDYIMILAPADPEKHLEYVKKVFPYGKTTYVDKTFAPDAMTAGEIFELGAKYGTPFFSSSALRYATELDGIEKPVFAATTGGGRSLEEYIIHQAEMLVRIMDGKASALKVEEAGEERLCSIRYADGREAQMLYGPTRGFSVKAELRDGRTVETDITSDYFKLLLGDILTFFVSGKPPFPPDETMEVMCIREAAVKGLTRPGEWMEL